MFMYSGRHVILVYLHLREALNVYQVCLGLNLLLVTAPNVLDGVLSTFNQLLSRRRRPVTPCRCLNSRRVLIRRKVLLHSRGSKFVCQPDANDSNEHRDCSPVT